jgi:hypothetical protein
MGYHLYKDPTTGHLIKHGTSGHLAQCPGCVPGDCDATNCPQYPPGSGLFTGNAPCCIRLTLTGHTVCDGCQGNYTVGTGDLNGTYDVPWISDNVWRLTIGSISLQKHDSVDCSGSVLSSCGNTIIEVIRLFAVPPAYWVVNIRNDHADCQGSSFFNGPAVTPAASNCCDEFEIDNSLTSCAGSAWGSGGTIVGLPDAC